MSLLTPIVKPMLRLKKLSTRQFLMYSSTNNPTTIVNTQSTKRASPEPLPLSSSELWHQSLIPPKPLEPEHFTEKTFLQHPLYTPPAKADISVPLVAPLKFPEWDQRIPSHQASGLPSPPTWNDIPFDNALEAPIGAYPRIKAQWAQLKDPFSYWDQQGKRNYGEVLYDHDNFTDILSIGPEMSWWKPFLGTLQTFGAIGLVSVLIYLWDPKAHLWFVRFFFIYTKKI
jgi:hypothetical protein